MSTTFKVVGSGQMGLYKNGGYIGVVDANTPRTLTFVAGDHLELRMTPASGWSFQKLCDFPYTECTYGTIQGFTITDPSIMPQMLIATFVQSGGGSGVTISSINITQGAQTYIRNISVGGSGSGTFRLTDNGSEFYRTSYNFSSGNFQMTFTDFASGTHNVCAEAV